MAIGVREYLFMGEQFRPGEPQLKLNYSVRYF